MDMVAVVIFRIAIITLITPLDWVDGDDAVALIVNVDETGLVNDITIVLELVGTVVTLVIVRILESILMIVVVVHIIGKVEELLVVVHVTERVRVPA